MAERFQRQPPTRGGRFSRSTRGLGESDVPYNDHLEPFKPGSKRIKVSESTEAENSNFLPQAQARGFTEEETNELPDLDTDTVTIDFHDAQLPQGSQETPAFVGFQTANQKPVYISEKAKKMVASMGFDVEPDEIHHTTANKPQERFAGFQTGGNAAKSASNDAQRRLQAIGFEFDDEHDGNGLSEPVAPISFARASSSSFQSSKNVGFAPSRDVAADLNDTDAGEFVGFRTGKNKPVEISDASKRRMKELGFDFDEGPTAEGDNNDSPQFVGFVTGAQRKPVQISEESKRRIAALGLELDDEEESDSVGPPQFQSARTKPGANSFQSAANNPNTSNTIFQVHNENDEEDDDANAEAEFERLLALRRQGLTPKPISLSYKGQSDQQQYAPKMQLQTRPLKSAKKASATTKNDVPPQMRPFKKPAAVMRQQQQHEDEEEADDGFDALDFLADETLAMKNPDSSMSSSSSTPTRQINKIVPAETAAAAPSTPSTKILPDEMQDFLAGIAAEDLDFSMNLDSSPLEQIPSSAPPQPPLTPTRINYSAPTTPGPSSVKVGALTLKGTPKPKSGANTPNLRRHDTSPRGLVDTSLRSPPQIIHPEPRGTPLNPSKAKLSVPTGKISGLETPRVSGLSRIAQKLDFPSEKQPAPLVAPRDAQKAPPSVKKKRERQVSYSTRLSGETSAEATPSIQLFDLESRIERISLRDFAEQKGRLPGRYTDAELQAYHLMPDVIHMCPDSAYHFEFKVLDHDTRTLRTIGPEELRLALIAAGADQKLASMQWVRNHYRWIVWKLAAMERSFPQDFGTSYVTPQRVLSQLKYRYEREINKAHRPAIRKILEQDEAAARHIVLALVAVRWKRGAPVSVPPDCEGAYSEDDFPVLQQASTDCAIVEVTDGWYSVHAVLDGFLTDLLERSKLTIGMKLHVALAEVIGAEQAQSPLEMSPSSAMLKLRVNGVKRAAWHEKLGVQAQRVFKTSLRAVRLNGGPAPLLDVFVQRAYPVLFSESFGSRGDPSRVNTRCVRNFRGESKAAERHERRLETFVESVRCKILAEFEAQREQKKRESKIRLKGVNIASKDIDHDGETLYEMMLASNDEEDFARSLPPTWRYELEKYLNQLKIDQEDRLNSEVKTAIAETADVNREVMPMLRLLVCDYCEHDPSNPNLLSMALLTIWRPSKDFEGSIREGMRLQLFGATATYKPSVHTSADELNTIRLSRKTQSIPIQLSCAADKLVIVDRDPKSRSKGLSGVLLSRHFAPRVAVPLAQLPRERGISIYSSTNDGLIPKDEFDSAGVVLEVSESRHSTSALSGAASESFTVHLGDQHGNMVAILIEMHPDSLPSKTSFKKGAILAFQNVRFRYYDEEMQLFLCEANESAEFYFQQPMKPSLKHLSSLWMSIAAAFRESDEIMDFMYAQLYAVIGRGVDLEKPLPQADVAQAEANPVEEHFDNVMALEEEEPLQAVESSPAQSFSLNRSSSINRSMVNKSLNSTRMLSNPM